MVKRDSVTASAVVPAVVEAAGPEAKRRFVEFFTANIRNVNTRQSYLQCVRFFCRWCEERDIPLLSVEPTLVAAYIEEISQWYADGSVKVHLAAIRMLFDYFVTGGLLPFNPAQAVRGPKVVIVKGKTPVLSAADARLLLDSIDTSHIMGLRDRALIGTMVYSFARISATLKMNVDDVWPNGHRYWIRLHEKGGRYHEMPLHHNAEQYLLEYLDAAQLRDLNGTPLFRTIGRRRELTETRMHRNDALRMIKRRAKQAGISPRICCHTFRATGITEYMRNGGTLEKAQQMAAHASSKTTNMYNRVNDAVSLDEVERIVI
ncbi:MAG: tyrosine-type recombinase/integrase [Planctomycetaceae bacterium]|nr:tyrosine-type recombinase/integrase [Planctomycetaceae bacterium]